MDRQVSVISVAHEEALKKKFSGHRSVTSSIGIMKILGAVLFLIGSIISLSAQVCSKDNNWLELVFPIVILASGVIVATSYTLAILGVGKKIPNTWAKLDIFACLVTAVITLVVSILLLSQCSYLGAMSQVPGILGIIGASTLIIAAATLFVMWRNVEDEVLEIPTVNPNLNKRKSVFI